MDYPIRLIIGLGNFPPEYALTRHNAGRWFVERLAGDHQLMFRSEAKLQSSLARLVIADQECKLAFPNMLMNVSGEAVLKIAHFYKIMPEEILIAHDDLDFPAGVMKLKFAGGDGGHNGLASIISHLGTANFYRLRIGIGRPAHKEQVIDYVLQRPSKADREQINLAIDRALAIVPELLQGQMAIAMNKLHASG